MADGLSRRFDLKTLLKLGDLDIRRVARNDLSMQVGDYFALLCKFINRVPMITEALGKIASLNAAEYDFRSLGDIKYLLDGIGHVKFMKRFDEIASAGKRGHTKFASNAAKSLLKDFNLLCDRILSAEKTQQPDSEGPAGDDPTYENYKAQFLKKVLQLLDHEESSRKMRILAVDDSPVMLKTISALLSNEYEVYGMANPTLLEKFLQKMTPELFLLDFKMPELSGFDLVPIIRTFEEHKETPIIFLTSMGTVDHVSAALALGACDYLVKPFQEINLREKVAKHIVRKKLF